MNDDTQESGHHRRYFRYAVLTLATLLVVSLGFVLIPREPEPPAAPPFSEQSRASAYSAALALRAAGLGLESAYDGALPAPQSASLGRAVTLLTVQARALMLPADAAGPSTSAAPAPVLTQPSTLAALAAALQASGSQRLKDAETADGGIARLLAGAGTAQLLAAEELAAAVGVALDAVSGAATSPNTASPAPAAFPTASASASCTSQATAGASTGDGLGSSLVSAEVAELELIYAYQAALPRLDPRSVNPASGFLAQHEKMRTEAEMMSGSRCAAAPPGPAGYALSPAFLGAPAAALGTLEAGTLPVFGDVVALSDGAERSWALEALQAAARRTVHWGASPGPVPGVVLDESLLPELATAAPAPGPAATSPRQP